MEVKPGYKQTKVGMIPDDWDAHRLTSLADVRDGTHDSPRYTAQGIPFVTSKNIVSGGVNFDDITFISEESAREVNKRSKVDRNDILLSMIGTVGNAALVDFEPNFCIKNVALIKPNPSRADSRYLIQLFMSDRYARYIGYQLEGGIQKFISLGVLRSLDVPLPPTKAEQEAIAEALSNADALIESLEQLLVKKRQLKQGTMQQLLTGKTRLPGFGQNAGHKQTDVGVIPEDWNVLPLRKACTLHNGRAYALTEWETIGVPVIRLQNLTGGSEYYYSTLELPEKKYCNRGDLLYMWSATFGPRIWKGDRAIYHYHIWKVVPHDGQAIRRYLYYKLNEITEDKKTRAANGGTMLHITKGSMESTLIALPDCTEQRAIASTLYNMEAEITALQRQQDKTKQIKQGMMQQLLTGQIRLVTPPKAEAKA